MSYHIFRRTSCGTFSSNSDKVCAKNCWWKTWRQKVQPDWTVLKKNIYLMFTASCIWWHLSWVPADFPLPKMWLFLLLKKKMRFEKGMHRLSTELWMGSVAVKFSVAGSTKRLAAAEEICPHSLPAACTFWGSYEWCCTEVWLTPVSLETLWSLVHGNSTKWCSISSSNHAIQTVLLRPESGFLYYKVPVSRSLQSS